MHAANKEKEQTQSVCTSKVETTTYTYVPESKIEANCNKKINISHASYTAAAYSSMHPAEISETENLSFTYIRLLEYLARYKVRLLPRKFIASVDLKTHNLDLEIFIKEACTEGKAKKKKCLNSSHGANQSLGPKLLVARLGDVADCSTCAKFCLKSSNAWCRWG